MKFRQYRFHRMLSGWSLNVRQILVLVKGLHPYCRLTSTVSILYLFGFFERCNFDQKSFQIIQLQAWS
jgi:hypothetical protein